MLIFRKNKKEVEKYRPEPFCCTEKCGNVYDAYITEGHTGYYEPVTIQKDGKEILRTYCHECCVYWDKEYKKIKPKRAE